MLILWVNKTKQKETCIYLPRLRTSSTQVYSQQASRSECWYVQLPASLAAALAQNVCTGLRKS